MEATIQSLSGINEGTKVVCEKITGEPLFKRHLTELGFIAGEEILVLHNPGPGSLIVNIKDTKLALGQGEADRIIVSEINE